MIVDVYYLNTRITRGMDYTIWLLNHDDPSDYMVVGLAEYVLLVGIGIEVYYGGAFCKEYVDLLCRYGDSIYYGDCKVFDNVPVPANPVTHAGFKYGNYIIIYEQADSPIGFVFIDSKTKKLAGSYSHSYDCNATAIVAALVLLIREIDFNVG